MKGSLMAPGSKPPTSERDQARDMTALKALYERHAEEVYGFVRRLLGDRDLAEDVVQETFIRIYQSGVAEPSRSYIFRAAHNISLNVLKSQRRLKGLSQIEPATEGDVPGEAARRELKELVSEALLTLAPEHRAVLVLRHFHGLMLKNISEVLCCTERTTRNRLRAAGVLLERELRGRGLVPEEVMP